MTDTKERLSEIEARANAATKGPWRLSGDPVKHLSISLRGPTPDLYLGRIHTGSYDYIHNAEFIANSREDIPWLISEVRRLRALELERSDSMEKLQRLGQEYDNG